MMFGYQSRAKLFVMCIFFATVHAGATLLYAHDNPPSSMGSIWFYESYEDLTSLQDNGGRPGSNGVPSFLPGVVGNAADFTGSRSVCYPLTDHFSRQAGTLEFWVQLPPENHLGLFDIGVLGRPNSWGIFKNRDHLIMEVKDQDNRYDQAWSPAPIDFECGSWHFVAAVWEQRDETTLFKVCVDGVCKAEYDGITRNSFPNMNGEFCVGWSGWYGFSQSMFDELQIFDHARSDIQIAEDFNQVVPENSEAPDTDGNLIVNGDFEAHCEPHFPDVPTHTWTYYQTDSLGGWTVANTYPDQANYPSRLEIWDTLGGHLAASGTQYVELDGYDPTTISQTPTTAEGDCYELSYAWSPRPGVADNKMKVYIDGIEVAHHDATGRGLGTTNWHWELYQFQAASTSTNVAFSEVGPDNQLGMLLDAVSLTTCPSRP